MIGYSLSLCIASIAEGKTAEGDVQKIIAATRAATPADFEWVIEHYNEMYWDQLPEAENIARRLWAAGKIEQPRVQGNTHPGIDKGIWEA